MIGKLALILVLLAGISGCSTMSGFIDPDHPGTFLVAGGQLQLLFANPEFNDFNPNDPLAKSEMAENQQWSKKVDSPLTTGGVGMMEIWRF